MTALDVGLVPIENETQHRHLRDSNPLVDNWRISQDLHNIMRKQDLPTARFAYSAAARWYDIMVGDDAETGKTILQAHEIENLARIHRLG